MLSLTRDLLRKTQDKGAQEIKPLTACFWSDFASNPAVMYGLFAPNPRHLDYNPEKVKVMGTKDGMVDQIMVATLEDLDMFHEQAIGLPLLMRIWVEFSTNDYIGAAQPEMHFEGDLAMLMDTSHPMIRPQLEIALEQARKVMQDHGRFCIQIDLGSAIDRWLKTTYKRRYCSLCRLRNHSARLYITNYVKPLEIFDCGTIGCALLAPCWLLSAPFYKIYRRLKCRDIIVELDAPIVRRATLAISGIAIEVTQ